MGWLNGNEEYKIPEHSLIKEYYLPEILEKKIKEIDKDIFANLTPSEEQYVLDTIHNELRNATEERILNYLKYGVKIVVNNETLNFWLIDYKNNKNAFFFLHEAKYKGSWKGDRAEKHS